MVLSARYGDPSFCTLLRAQPYLGTVWADPRWQIEERGAAPTNPWCFTPEGEWDTVIHLGYQRWPQNVLPVETYLAAVSQFGHELPSLDLTRPWISCARMYHPDLSLVIGWTDEHFELKYGITALGRWKPAYVIVPPLSRWSQELGDLNTVIDPCDWLIAAQYIQNAQVFLGDCASLHVLAVALGKPAIIMEPSEARWNPIFWPLGMDGPQVTCVKGHDGRPTFDARAVRHAITQALSVPSTSR